MKITGLSVYRVRRYAGGVETPFGSCGKSGYGREALWNHVQTKNAAIKPG